LRQIRYNEIEINRLMIGTQMKTDKDATLVIDVVEAGRRLGIGRSAAYQAVHAGQIPSVRIGGLIKVPVVALQRMLDRAAENVCGGTSARPSSGTMK
jgi:excisionase family DNA binding protein